MYLTCCLRLVFTRCLQFLRELELLHMSQSDTQHVLANLLLSRGGSNLFHLLSQFETSELLHTNSLQKMKEAIETHVARSMRQERTMPVDVQTPTFYSERQQRTAFLKSDSVISGARTVDHQSRLCATSWMAESYGTLLIGLPFAIVYHHHTMKL